MALRVQLLHDFLGSLVIDQADPIDINAVVQTLKRSEENDGVIYEVVLDLEFIKKGRNFIKEAYDNYGGIDAVVNVNLYEYNPNLRKWSITMQGQINYTNFDLKEDRVTVAIEQTGFQRRVLNLLAIDVDLETIQSQSGAALPPADTLDVPFHSKAILKATTMGPSDNSAAILPDAITFTFGECVNPVEDCIRPRDMTIYGNIENGSKTLDELTEVFTYPWGYLDEPVEIWKAGEAGPASIEVKVRVKIDIRSFVTGGPVGGNDVDTPGNPCGSDCELGIREVIWWFEHRDKDDNIKNKTSFGHQVTTEACGSLNEIIGSYETHTFTIDNLPVEVEDKIYIYHSVRIHADYEIERGIGDTYISHQVTITPDKDNTYIKITAKTSTDPSTVKGLLIYEAVERCCQYYTDQVSCFKSDLLGRTDLGYSVDGPLAMILITNGNRIRGRNERQIFSSLERLLEFINAIGCIGFGFESIDGQQVLRLEFKSYFYRKDLKILSLGQVYNVGRKVLPERFYNLFEYGYPGKLDIGSVNGIDEFNTIRRQKVPIVNTKNQKKAGSSMRTSGYQIEYQRRLSVTTEDSNLDDELFAVSVIRTEDGFKSKQDEGYAEITNVYDAPTGYNYDLSPGRAIENWKTFIASTLIRSASKVLTFIYGEINYTMTTRKDSEATAIVENGNVDLTNVVPIWDNERFYFTAPLNQDQVKLIKAAPYGYVEFQDLFNQTFEGFLQSIDWDENKKQAEFELLKVYRA